MKKDNTYIIAAIITSLEAIGVTVGCGLAAEFKVSPFWWFFPMWIIPALVLAAVIIYGLVTLGIWIRLSIMFRDCKKMDFNLDKELENEK